MQGTKIVRQLALELGEKLYKPNSPKEMGAFYTDELVAEFLVNWAIRSSNDVAMDPGFGTGVFIRAACRKVNDLGGIPSKQVSGVEIDDYAFLSTSEALASEFDLPNKAFMKCDFFRLTPGSFLVDVVVGNPPFIRYQRFNGTVRDLALARALSQGVKLSRLSSSWAPFLVHAISMLKPGGRLAMVIPFELTHASYAQPILRHLAKSFGKVTFLTFQNKLFQHLSEDTLLLLAEDKGDSDTKFLWRHFNNVLQMTELMATSKGVDVPKPSILDHKALYQGRTRLNAYMLPEKTRALLTEMLALNEVMRLGNLANVGIGYVTGANNFFHITPEEASCKQIPKRFLVPALRRGRALIGLRFTDTDWQDGLKSSDTGYLLHIESGAKIPASVVRYLELGIKNGIPKKYKCRNRSPWYSIPHVYHSDAFLSYMSGQFPKLVANDAGVVATNTLHVVRIYSKSQISGNHLAALWQNSLTLLSAEMEGHALGGGMLKMEPSEARRVLLPMPAVLDNDIIDLLDSVYRKNGPRDALNKGDDIILIKGVGLSVRDCKILRSGAEILFNRRLAMSKRCSNGYRIPTH